MTRPQIEGDELEMLNELEEAEDVGSHKRMIEALIREAYDERDTNSFVYDPLEERITPLSTDEMREICWRYDAPAIDPDHVMSWPRDRSDKRAVLAAICRYEGIDSSGGVKAVIREQLGEGDPITVREVEGEHNKDVRAPRNIHNYHDHILDELEEHPLEEADNLPDGFHADVDPMFGDDEDKLVDTAEEWLERTREAVANDELPVDGVLVPRKRDGEKILEEYADHPHVHLIREGVDALEDEIERRRQSDDDDFDDDGEEIAEEDVGKGLDVLDEAEEADDGDEDENQPATDRSETEKKREAIERKRGDPTTKK